MKSSVLTLALLGVLVGATPVAAQQFIDLPAGSWANDVTPDGEIVVGSWNFGDGFIWRWRVDSAPTVILGGDVVAVSDDGSVVAGTIIDPGVDAEVAAIWTAATGWQSLGWLPGALSCPSRSNAYDISGDGTTVVGLSWQGCSGRGFRWTAATGMQELQNLVNGNNRCSTISGDGTTLAGFAQGTFNRTPAYWAEDTSGFVLDPDFEGEVHGLNEDGSKSVGTLYFTGIYFDAFIRDAQSGVTTNLGSLHTNWAAAATDLSADSSVIVGYDYISLSRQAWVWTSTDGMQSLNARLIAAGITGAPNLLVCRKVSEDGTVIVGGGDGGGFIVELPLPTAAWTNLGNGLAGTNGIPSLAGTGPLTAGSATSVVLAQAKPGSAGAFVVGLSSIYIPFKQGVLVPFPLILMTIPAVAPSGSVSLQFPWPAGVPGDVSLYWQCIVSDPAALAGFALSNALQSTTP